MIKFCKVTLKQLLGNQHNCIDSSIIVSNPFETYDPQ
jgi:hypothetical protein